MPQTNPVVEFDDEMRQISHSMPEKKYTEALEDKLNAKAGVKGNHPGVLQRGQLQADPDAKEILEKGRFSKTVHKNKDKKMTLKEGSSGQCHDNTARLYDQGEIDDIVFGYCQHIDGTWRQHTWGMKNGKIVETTLENYERAYRYYGTKLSKNAADDFSAFVAKLRNEPGLMRNGNHARFVATRRTDDFLEKYIAKGGCSRKSISKGESGTAKEIQGSAGTQSQIGCGWSRIFGLG